jgi:hypothetical protein
MCEERVRTKVEGREWTRGGGRRLGEVGAPQSGQAVALTCVMAIAPISLRGRPSSLKRERAAPKRLATIMVVGAAGGGCAELLRLASRGCIDPERASGYIYYDVFTLHNETFFARIGVWWV